MHPNPPNTFSTLLAIWQLEFSRLFLTHRGIIYLITFAVIWFCILHYAVGPLAISSKPKLTWPVAELEVYWHLSFDMFPVLCILSAAGQTASDRDRGTLRFLTLHCSRDMVFFGRFSSQILIQSFLIIATLSSTLLMVIMRDPSLLMPGLHNAWIIALNLIFIVLPFLALLALLSASFNSTRQVMVLAILIWILSATLIDRLSVHLPALDFLNYLVPGMQITELALLPPSKTFLLAHIPILQSLVLLVLGRTIMARSAL